MTDTLSEAFFYLSHHDIRIVVSRADNGFSGWHSEMGWIDWDVKLYLRDGFVMDEVDSLGLTIRLDRPDDNVSVRIEPVDFSAVDDRPLFHKVVVGQFRRNVFGFQCSPVVDVDDAMSLSTSTFERVLENRALE